eukprot:m.302045 g.302045  ORF g.302045 m.302045 type:complete len:1077 (-) comp19571_c0_seq12:105-3335(-)
MADNSAVNSAASVGPEPQKLYWQHAVRALVVAREPCCAAAEQCIGEIHKKISEKLTEPCTKDEADCAKEPCNPCKDWVDEAKNYHHGKPTAGGSQAVYRHLRDDPVELAKLFMARLGAQSRDKQFFNDFDFSSILNVLTFAKTFANDPKDKCREFVKSCTDHRNHLLHNLTGKDPCTWQATQLETLLDDLLGLLKSPQFETVTVAGSAIELLEETRKAVQDEDLTRLRSDAHLMSNCMLVSQLGWSQDSPPLHHIMIAPTEGNIHEQLAALCTPQADDLATLGDECDPDLSDGTIVARVRGKWRKATHSVLVEAEKVGVIDGTAVVKRGIVKVKVNRKVVFGERLCICDVPGVATGEALVAVGSASDGPGGDGLAHQGDGDGDHIQAVVALCLATTIVDEDKEKVAPCLFFSLFDDLPPEAARRRLLSFAGKMCSQQDAVSPSQAPEQEAFERREPGLYCKRGHAICDFHDLCILKGPDHTEMSIKFEMLEYANVDRVDKEQPDEIRPQHVLCKTCRQHDFKEPKVGATCFKIIEEKQVALPLIKRKLAELVGLEGLRRGKNWRATDLDGIEQRQVKELDNDQDLDRPLPSKLPAAETMPLDGTQWSNDSILEAVAETMAEEYKPRPYQQEILLAAAGKNVLVCLPTGMGKTFVAATLIAQVLHRDPSKIAIMLAPKVALAKQQAEQMFRYFDERQSVTVMAGGDMEHFGQEDGRLNILVATPGTLMHLKRLEEICSQTAITVIDEAHWASDKKAPLFKLLEKLKGIYESQNRTEQNPWLTVGLTAVPGQTDTEIRDLCNLLPINGRPLIALTSDDRPASAKTVVLKVQPDVDEDSMQTRLHAANRRSTGSAHCLEKSQVEHTNTHVRARAALHKKIGQVGLRLLLRQQQQNDDMDIRGLFERAQVANLPALAMPGLLPLAVGGKLKAMLDELAKLAETGAPPRAIVYVHRWDDVQFLCECLKTASSLKEYSWIKPDCVAGKGKMSSERVRKKLADFRTGTVTNLLVSTPVLEEGIDVPDCDSVVCFDQATCFRAFVQWKGRARREESCLMTFFEDDVVQMERERCMHQVVLGLME